jgi:predicted DNA-binding protein
MRNKQAISFRLSPEAIELIKELAKKLGVSQADIIELAVRKLAKQEQDK